MVGNVLQLRAAKSIERATTQYSAIEQKSLQFLIQNIETNESIYQR